MRRQPETETAASYQAEEVACYLCGADDSEDFLFAEEDYTGRPGTFRMVRCKACGLVYQNPRLTLEEVKPFYDEAYISHRKQRNLGPLQPLFDRAMGAHDRRKVELVGRYAALGPKSRALDVGCAAGTFLLALRERFGCRVSGLDFKDLSSSPGFEHIDFHHGLFCEQDFGAEPFDLITMWHFLEHDYEPLRSLATARELLSPDGVLVIEVPRLDSNSFRLYGRHWPGVQAPQHTMMLDKASALAMVSKAGLELVEYMPCGTFPPAFYLFLGLVFRLNKARGISVRRLLLPYVASSLLLTPVTLMQRHLNLCMQTLVCRRPRA